MIQEIEGEFLVESGELLGFDDQVLAVCQVVSFVEVFLKQSLFDLLLNLVTPLRVDHIQQTRGLLFDGLFFVEVTLETVLALLLDYLFEVHCVLSRGNVHLFLSKMTLGFVLVLLETVLGDHLFDEALIVRLLLLGLLHSFLEFVYYFLGLSFNDIDIYLRSLLLDFNPLFILHQVLLPFLLLVLEFVYDLLGLFLKHHEPVAARL